MEETLETEGLMRLFYFQVQVVAGGFVLHSTLSIIILDALHSIIFRVLRVC